jgi:hypothetical protein
MKRSTQVGAPLLAAAAMAMLAGCKSPEMQRCVDENNKVVDDSLCHQTGQQQRPDGHGGFIFVPMPYHYYYGGYGGFAPGSVVGGGSYTPAPGHTYSSTSRGGFGSSFSGGHGEGGGEGAGE